MHPMLLVVIIGFGVGLAVLPTMDAQSAAREADMGDFEYDAVPRRFGAVARRAPFATRNADFNNGTIVSTNSLTPARLRAGAARLSAGAGASVASRSRGWKVCWGFWRFKGCVIFTKSGNGIRIRVTLFGRTRFNRRFSSPRNFTIKIRKRIFPRWMRWLMRSDLEIRITRIDLLRLKACFQLRVKIRFIGTKVFPRRPFCVDF